MTSFQTKIMDTVASSMTDGCKNLLTQLSMHSNGILNHIVSKIQSKMHANLMLNADNNNGESNQIKVPNHHAFFDSSKENVEESDNDCLMMSENIYFQRANDLSVLLKRWCDGDQDEGIIRPSSSLTATTKNTPEIQDKCSRHKDTSEECERCGGEKGDDHGKGNFMMFTKIA